MKYPAFFNQIPTLKLYDSLSEFLLAFEDGIIEFTYLDCVKTAGHSCPTVAGAYLLCHKALAFLFPESLPLRGEIKVEFKESEESGVTGVIANVIENITGATEKRGFKGIGGAFPRHSKMSFNIPMQGQVRFTRQDTNQSVELIYNPNIVPPFENQMPMLQSILKKQANTATITKFKQLWQQRVKEILIDNFNNPNLVKIID